MLKHEKKMCVFKIDDTLSTKLLQLSPNCSYNFVVAQQRLHSQDLSYVSFSSV